MIGEDYPDHDCVDNLSLTNCVIYTCAICGRRYLNDNGQYHVVQ